MALAPKEEQKRIGQVTFLQKPVPAATSRISNCLDDLKSSWRKKGALAAIWQEWSIIAGPQLAKNSRIIGFRNGILIIGASHPQWLQALLYNRTQLLAAIKAKGHKVKILKIEHHPENNFKKLEGESVIWAKHPSRIDIHGLKNCNLCGNPAPVGETTLWGKCSFCRRKELSK